MLLQVVSFHSHSSIQTGVTVQKMHNSGQNQWFCLSHVTLKFKRWPWKTIGHHFYATSSFVQNFIAIFILKLELQSENAQFGMKSEIFLSCVNLEFDGWPWKINKAPLLYYFQLCASFHSNLWIQTGVTAPKFPNWDKISFYLCDLHLWPMTLTFCMEIPSKNGNNCWKFDDDTMRETLRKNVTDGQTDGSMDRSVLRAAWSQLKIR